VSMPEDVHLEPVNEDMLQEQCSHLSNTLHARCAEAYVQILAEFIDGCTKYPSPTALTTIKHLPHLIPLAGGVHSTHQVHLAESIKGLLDLQTWGDELIQGLQALPLFQQDHISWLDDPNASQMITETFAVHRTYVKGVIGSSI